MNLLKKIKNWSLVMVLLGPNLVLAQIDSSLSGAAQAPLKLLNAANRGVVLVKQRLAVQTPIKPVASTKVALPVVLALWNKTTDQISLVNGKKTNGKFSTTDSAAPEIKIVRGARLSTRYQTNDSNIVVVAAADPLLAPRKLKKRRLVYDVTMIAHVSPSQEFFTPYIYGSGSDYLSFLIQKAFDDLNSRGVVSRYDNKSLVTEVIDSYLIKSIIISEQTDPATLLRGDADHSVEAFLVNLATNRDDAYDQALSTAGALGLVQFIPSTYKLVVKGRGEAGLITDFKVGMRDHVNAIKAQALLLDSDLASMPGSIKAKYVKNLGGGLFLAAAYNGGAGRVKSAFGQWGDNWAGDYRKALPSLQLQNKQYLSQIKNLKRQIKKTKGTQLTKLKSNLAKTKGLQVVGANRIAFIKKNALKNETVLYVAKVDKLYAMFTAGMYATPNAPSGTLPVVAARN